jgi:uncharacterized NAD-dependent epimerase/dehydratase family protein
MVDTPRRLAIMAEASFAPNEAKTAIGLLRYRLADVACVLDSTRAGRSAEVCVGIGGATPVVATLDDAAACGANALLLGIAPAGGRLPPPWRAVVRDALERGWDVVSGLHVFLADDPEFAALAAARAARIHDVRRPPAGLGIGLARAAEVDALVVLTVGTDCNVGKMTAALELRRELAQRGVRAAFVATGQTGIMIEGAGIAVDAVPADFVAGAAERLVLEASRAHDVVIVEGQGSLHHPAFAGVTLGLLHGACPAALVLCHHHGRTRMRIGSDDSRAPLVPDLASARDAHEVAAAWVRPARVVAAAINTHGSSDAEALRACAAAAHALHVPATDPVRHGAGPLADAIQAVLRARGAHGAATSTG